MLPTMSVLGMYNYDNTLFDMMQIPEGVSRETLVENLLSELAGNEVLYPNHTVLKALIGIWSTKRLKTWEKLYNTTILEYDPISNYDRTEEWSEDKKTTGKSTNSVTGNTIMTNDQTNKVAGYNSETLVNESEITSTGTNDSTSSGTSEGNGSESGTRKGRAYGNIGVTTSQQMIEAERQVSEFDIYSYIIGDFQKRFCLMIY